MKILQTKKTVAPYPQSLSHYAQRGFSLLELLVVVAILAVIAFVSTTGLFGVTDRAEGQIATAELAAAAKAVRQFRADTGYFPTEGVFASQDCGVNSTYNPNNLGQIDLGSCNAAWFYHAANLSQLTGTGGMKAAMETAMPWNAVAERGWRGPYLSDGANAFADIGVTYQELTDLSAINNSFSNGSDSGTLVTDIPVVLAGVSLRPTGNYFVTKRQTGGTALDVAPRPIFMFVRKDSTSGRADRVALVTLGANGEFDGLNDDCTPDAGGDDMAICVYANK